MRKIGGYKGARDYHRLDDEEGGREVGRRVHGEG